METRGSSRRKKFNDNQKLIFGTGGDVEVYYDGTDLYVVSDIIAPSDLRLDCGANKTMELQSSVWDDQQVNLGTIAKGASAPTDQAYKGGQVLAFNAAQDNKITFIMQMSHKLKHSTNIEFHLHDTVPDDNTGNIRWVLTYSFIDIGSDFPAESSSTTLQAIDTNQDEHMIHQLTTNIGQSTGVSAIAIMSLMREGTHEDDTYGSDAYLIALDAHFEMDTIGSRQITVK